MSKKLFIASLLVLLASRSVTGAPTEREVAQEANRYFDDRERGYYFYEDPAPEKEIPEKKIALAPPVAAPAPAPAEPDEKSYLGQLKAMGRDWEEQMALAILQPTRENMRSWMETHKKIVKQARTFSDKYEKTIWTTPSLDRSVEQPINTNLNLAENLASFNEENNDLKALAESKGLLYFFRSDCPHCRKFSPIIKSFAEEHGFSILPVTLDGFPVTEFPNPKFPGSMAQDLNVSAVPAVFLVDPKHNEVIPAAWGFNDKTQLRRKLFYAAQQMQNETEESDLFYFNGAAL